MRKFAKLFLPVLLVGSGLASAEVLLTGTGLGADESERPFELTGESRDDVIGGTMSFGDDTFEIVNLSVHRLIGGVLEGEKVNRYAVFSSSFSTDTATGDPWVAATTSHQCDKQYNSFIAIYSVGSDKQANLDSPPFKKLTDSVDAADESVVYCFMSLPPK